MAHLLARLGEAAVKWQRVSACRAAAPARRRHAPPPPLQLRPPAPDLSSSLLCLQVGGSWRKPAISAKNLARLRKETLLEGGCAAPAGAVGPCNGFSAAA